MMLIPVAFIVTVAVLLQLLETAQGEPRCRPEYRQISSSHSACIAPNNQCKILKKGVEQKYRDQILKLHNDLRSKLATGREHRGGGMAQASNMLEMEWDDELTAVAEKWSENCVYKHDCNECRTVPRWSTGQNIAYLEWYCASPEDCKRGGIDIFEPDWPAVMYKFYDEEVVEFEQRLMNNFQETPYKNIGHFTQIAWANSYKIGCGFTVFPYGNGYRQFYVCNYGPQGNMLYESIYKQGSPCSACPANSECSGQYEGLCKVSSGANPVQQPSSNNNQNNEINNQPSGNNNNWNDYFPKNFGGFMG